MKDRAIWLLALGTISVSIGTSAVVVTALTPNARERLGVRTEAPDEAAGAGAYQAVARELSALREFLERQEHGGLEPAPSVVATRRPAGERDEGIAANDIDRLIQAIDRLEAALRDESQATRVALVDASADGVTARERPAEIDWKAWHELWDGYVADEKTAVNEVRLLTTGQLLARFGPPTEVSTRENGLRNWYYYDKERGEPLNVTVQIVDGYVTWMWMEF